MHLKRLAAGERAPEGWDYIRIERANNGEFSATGAIAHAGGAVLSMATYESREKAEQAGRVWANAHGAEIVYLETFD